MAKWFQRLYYIIIFGSSLQTNTKNSKQPNLEIQQASHQSGHQSALFPASEHAEQPSALPTWNPYRNKHRYVYLVGGRKRKEVMNGGGSLRTPKPTLGCRAVEDEDEDEDEDEEEEED
ncbi:hypothetical protein ANN_04410 [Periplaneta americana]|uniref:Uncharacterized protein n=1 Tax=Periplaneta americana TaxID=6978 RepID=A0ABQ8TAI1_PERAM|nr:hypothetical protein ANN_04410 [Periplaneta americana]